MPWTKDQQKVISTRNANILVSASAGSGKTAVLVERILAYLTDPVSPVDIDHLLIVTFTRAAAGEMKERIGAAIDKALDADPENENLLRQQTLLHNAKITTIDGFCSWLCRAYGHLTDLESGFRVGEPGEMDLLRQETLRRYVSELHGAEDADFRERFLALRESFAPGRAIKPLLEVIERLFEASESQPYPDLYFEALRESCGAETFEEFCGLPVMRDLFSEAEELIARGEAVSRENLDLVMRPDGPSAYLPNAEPEITFFATLKKQKDYASRRSALLSYSAPRLSSARAKAGEDPALREVYKNNRVLLKEIRETLTGIYAASPEDVMRTESANEQILRTLIDVTEGFRARYAEKKQEKRVVDFADLEHTALVILRGERGEGRTDAARELARSFEEVLVDEYQDSNNLQEAILTAVSRIEDGEMNYFCVGDVKQSIYAFRHARPDLFMEKFHTYTPITGPSAAEMSPAAPGVRIDLTKNFRSRHEVLETANGLFSQLMRSEVGGVDYDDEAALVPGADYIETPDDSCRSELVVIFTGEEDEEGETYLEDTGSAAKRALEARVIGERIRTLISEGRIYDGRLSDNKGEAAEKGRPVEYRDIVILLRTMSGWADIFQEVLLSMGIPAFSTARTGYFSALEVVTVLNLLRILDNPEQDIPFAAVLASPVCGLTAEELAMVKGAIKDLPDPGKRYYSFHRAARIAASGEGGPVPEDCRRKLTAFFTFFDDARSRAPYTPIHELIYAVMTETGYFDYASALPGGPQRAANLRMLIEKAIEFEETDFTGLTSFIRYIENLEKYDVDFGESVIHGENENTVRIISIHKSKGLEYPVVFVAGLGKSFNKKDLSASFLIDPASGIASDYVNLERRTRQTTLRKEAISRHMLRDMLGEELRVLYVALTRAKHKLIMTGCVKDEDKFKDMSDVYLPLREEQLPAAFIMGASGPFAWLLPAADRMIRRFEKTGEVCPLVLKTISPSTLTAEETVAQTDMAVALSAFDDAAGGAVYDAEARQIIEERFSFSYPYAGREYIPVKVSVSELKAGYEPEEEAEVPYEEPQVLPYIPDFMREREAAESQEASTLRGASRGTAYHRVMELLDLTAIPAAGESVSQSGRAGESSSRNGKTGEIGFRSSRTEEHGSRAEMEACAARQIADFTERGLIGQDAADAVRLRDIASFLESPLAERMRAAQVRGDLRREQPFALLVGANEINPAYPESETIMVQGVIDAFFYEDDGIVLIDYKTDHVRTGQTLIDRYRIQLASYAAALTRTTSLPVRETYIWSFHLGRAIKL